MVLMISYELRSPGQNYESLYQEIRNVSGGVWRHDLTSHWLIETSLTPQQVWERLRHHIDQNDHILIIRVANNPMAFGWMPLAVWNWIAGRAY